MVDYICPLVADAFVNVLAVLSLGFAGYLFWMSFREKRTRQRQQRDRDRNRQKHWGYV